MKVNKKKIIVVMCILILVMAVAYAAFSTRLTIKGNSIISSNWMVEFTKIEEVSATSGVTIVDAPVAEGTSATFNVKLQSPGDKIVYDITVANNGSIDAIVSEINASETGSDAFYFNISGIKKGQSLLQQSEKIITVEIGFDESITMQPEITSNTLTMSIEFVQDLGQSIIEEDFEMQASTLKGAIFNMYDPQPDTDIDFSKSSAEDGTSGLYYTNTNTEDNGTTYYFRGNVENNYVSFGTYKESESYRNMSGKTSEVAAGDPIIWRIVRINEDGSIRLVKQDIAGSNYGNSSYNASIWDNAAVGFMYGEAGATGDNAYELTHKNTHDSTIKETLDIWYTKNLSNYSSLFVDAGFCNDRSTAPTAGLWNQYDIDTTLGYGYNPTYYGASNRIQNLKQPQFKCPQTNDLFTLKGSTKGNKSLDNPIGLLTIDEVSYAGTSVSSTVPSDYYLDNGYYWWTMSPRAYEELPSPNITVFEMQDWGIIMDNSNIQSETGIRPVINLRGDLEVTLKGTGEAGSITNPYIVKTN